MRFSVALALLASISLIPSLVRSAPVNDRIENATALDANLTLNRLQGSVTGTTEDGLSILLPGSTTPTAGYLFPSIWFSWTAPMAGKVSIQGAGVNFRAWGTTLLGPLGQSVYTVVGTDATTRLVSNTVSITSYDFDVTAGNVYYNALETAAIANPNRYTYVHRFIQGAISDDFATRTRLGGTNFTVRGNNATFDAEEGEPDHATNQITSTNKSAWFTWRSPNTRKSVTIEVKATSFEPLVVIYTGDNLTELTRVTRSQLSSDSNGNTATATFVAEDGVDYHIAVDGSKARAGVFSLSLKASTVRPGFLVQPAATTVQQGQVATFSATALFTGDTVEYKWERQLAGQKTWTPLADDEIFSGTQTAELIVQTTLEMNNDRFRVQAKDIVDDAYSRSATLTVTEFPVSSTEVRGDVSINLADGVLAGANGGYYTSRLPKGFTLDQATGVLTADNLVVKPGTYRITYWAVNDGVKTASYVVQVVVAPFSAALSGRFEGLLLDADDVPREKIALNVNTKGSFTGSIYSLADSRSYSFRGELSLDQNARIASVSDLTINRKAPLQPLSLSFSIAEENSGLTATLAEVGGSITTTSQGVKTLRFPATDSAPWAGRYTALLTNGVRVNPIATEPLPQGDGFATASISTAGVLVLRGRTPDGVPFTSSLASSSAAEYHLARKVYGGTGGYVAGRIKLAERDGSDVLFNSGESSGNMVYLTKPAEASPKLYPLGFSPVAYSFQMEPWFSAAGELTTLLGLDATGSVKAAINAPDVSNADPNVRGLPIDLTISDVGKVAVAGENTAKMAFKINRATGAYSGSFVVTDPSANPTRPVTRKVTFRGVLLQKSLVFEGIKIGGGYLLLPSLPNTPATTTSGSFDVLAGPPALPF